VRNNGSHGVNGLQIESLRCYLRQNSSELTGFIRQGKYNPNPVRRVEIPKDVHSKRPLRIPTVVDRVIQQAIHQVLSPVYERQFSDNTLALDQNGIYLEPCSVASDLYQRDINTLLKK